MEKVEEAPDMRNLDNNGDPEQQQQQEEEELELGLSLGAKKFTTACKPTCRILTAKDFRPLNAAGPTSSASSSSSSAVASAGTKRAKPGPTSPERAAGSSQPPSSQMAVGWPPVKAFRMNSLFNLSRDTADQNSSKIPNTVPDLSSEKNKEKEYGKEEGKKKLGNRTTSNPFVKVKMDGDPIGRKIDLNAINSYKSLASVLEIMFQKPGLGRYSQTEASRRVIRI